MRTFSKVLAYSLALLALIGCAPRRAQAQFLGYTSPQTEGQTLATNQACTGLLNPQIFVPDNLGQTQHTATVVSQAGMTSLEIEIDGVDRLGSVFRLSDQNRSGSIGGASTPISVAGNGYFPKIQIVVRCTGGLFNLSYSGSSSTPPINAGVFEFAQIDKYLASATSATATFQDNALQTPFGNSLGSIGFQFVGSASTGSTITLTCIGLGSTSPTYQTYTFALAAVTTSQTFPVPAGNCPGVIFTYTTGTGGGTFNAEYIFTSPGMPAITDPCSSAGITKSSAVVTAPAASATQIVALAAGQTIYVCGYQLTQTTAVGTLKWEYGTGSSCGSGTTALTGAMPTAAGIPLTYGGGDQSIFLAPTGNALCLVTAGAAANAAGVLTYVQQ